MTQTININDMVAITPNASGRRIMINKWGESYLNACHPGWKDGSVRLPLWAVMQVFGPCMWNGNPDPPFGTSISVEIEESRR